MLFFRAIILVNEAIFNDDPLMFKGHFSKIKCGKKLQPGLITVFLLFKQHININVVPQDTSIHDELL